MDREELRLRLVEACLKNFSQFNSENIVERAKICEAYITSDSEDKVQAPSDTGKEQQKGKAEPSKKKPR